LIIQVDFKDTSQVDPSAIVCSLSLIDSETTDDRNAVQRPKRKNATPGTGINSNGDYYFNLIGTKTSTAAALYDPEDKQHKYFVVFHDLRIRVRGLYRIKCTICDIQKYYCFN
jgi:hypothetical protein